LTLAAEKRIALPAAVRSLAWDQWFPGRLLRLADKLDRGQPLSEALGDDRRLLPREATVAARLGETTGNLATALRQVEVSDSLISPVGRSLVGHTFYLTLLAFIVPALVVLLTLWNFGVYVSIFDDYGIRLPDVTVWSVKSIYAGGPLLLAVPALAGALLLYVTLCYAEFLPWPWRLGLERGRLLRAVALGAETARPLDETLATLAELTQSAPVARRLYACAREAQSGVGWTTSLRKHRLIGKHEAALIDAAQRLNNLPWALRELADGADRRSVYRIEGALNVAGPLVLIIWGVVVLFFVLAYFVPLLQLIGYLSSS
jgi:type II secretory pathway component PulF